MQYLRKPTMPILMVTLLAMAFGPSAAMGLSCVPQSMAGCSAQSAAQDAAHPNPCGDACGCCHPSGTARQGTPAPADDCVTAYGPETPSALGPAGPELRLRAVPDAPADVPAPPAAAADGAAAPNSRFTPHTPVCGPQYDARPDAGRAPPVT